jgi:acetylglutamate synthase
MENASKALIMAGAILISILLISIGILLINSGKDITDTGKNMMSAQAIQTFNSQFIQYEGSNKSHAEVKQLLDTVISSNASHGNKVAIKLCRCGGDGQVLDSTRFYVLDPSRKWESKNVVSINEIITAFNKYPNSNFEVELFYPTRYEVEDINNNKHLNPIVRLCFACFNNKDLIRN